MEQLQRVDSEGVPRLVQEVAFIECHTLAVGARVTMFDGRNLRITRPPTMKQKRFRSWRMLEALAFPVWLDVVRRANENRPRP